MGIKPAVAAVALLFAGLPAAARARADLCPRVRFSGEVPKLTEVEKRLLCGDPDSDGWKNISVPEARSFMTAFLQARGRYYPKFDVDGETLVVRIGTTTVVRKLTGSGLDGIYDLGKRRKVVGQPLTPSLLDKVKKDVKFELTSRGYECPFVVVDADARGGEVHVDVRPGRRDTLDAVVPAQTKDVDPAVFRRYEAFQPGYSLYDARLLSLTGDRIKLDQLFLSAYYDTECSTGPARVYQRLIEGAPFLTTVGVGFDTEGLLIGKLRLQESRVGAAAGSAEADIYASSLVQSFDVFLKAYVNPADSVFVKPLAFVRRETEINYSAAHGEVNLEPGWTRDGDELRVEVSGGPTYDQFDTLSGLGPAHSSWAGFATHAQVMTHLYEYYRNDPRRGWTAQLDTASRVKGAASDVSAHALQASGESLWNLGRFEPPLAVLATRGMYGTTAVSLPSAAADAALPPTSRFFLGGDSDLRGFRRQNVPNDGAGFLTAAYQGVELRAGDVFPWNVQPFLFIDAAMAGRRSFQLDPNVYYSPGVGLRWGSPFGSLRATAARGLTWVRGDGDAPLPGWGFFFSFGKEF